MWKEHGDSLKHHLIGFYSEYTFRKEGEPALTMNEFADSYIKNEIAMEEGMTQYFNGLKEVDKKNQRVLKAIRSVKGKTYYKHLISYLKDASVTEWCEFEIVRDPVGDEQKVTEYGRSIKKEWVEQWSVGTEGDSFEGYICLELKPGRYLKFRFSC
jgi:hypothetical protein